MLFVVSLFISFIYFITFPSSVIKRYECSLHHVRTSTTFFCLLVMQHLRRPHASHDFRVQRIAHCILNVIYLCSPVLLVTEIMPDVDDVQLYCVMMLSRTLFFSFFSFF
jgi:hypothetical protein